MAANYYYKNRSKSNKRRWALIIIVVTTVGLAVWSVFFKEKKANSGKGLQGYAKNNLTAVTQQPDITLPQGKNTSQTNKQQIDKNTAKGITTITQGNSVNANTNTGTESPQDTGDNNSNNAESNQQTQIMFEQGTAAMQAGDYITARKKLSTAVTMGLNDQQDRQARDMLNKAADKWLFSPNIYSGDTLCTRYRVDTNLANIGKKFAVPYQLLAKINGIKNPNRIAAGRTVKVIQGPFNVVVNRSKFLMSVYLKDILVRSYPVTTGLPGRETPTGLWQVELKQKNPEWTDPDTHKKYLPNDPQNPLGERWIRLKGLQGEAVGRTGIGIHGTIKPGEIRTQASRGCIRLLNKDVEELYDLVVVKKSKVTITK